MTTDKVVLTDSDRAFAQELAALCRKHNIHAFHGSFSPDEYRRPEVRVTWSQGRHGDIGNIQMSSEHSESFMEQPRSQRKERT